MKRTQIKETTSLLSSLEKKVNEARGVVHRSAGQNGLSKPQKKKKKVGKREKGARERSRQNEGFQKT